jgi:hypothetical protein
MEDRIYHSDFYGKQAIYQPGISSSIVDGLEC